MILFMAHIDNIDNTADSRVPLYVDDCVCYHILSFCPGDVRLVANDGLIPPVMEYAIADWDPHQVY